MSSMEDLSDITEQRLEDAFRRSGKVVEAQALKGSAKLLEEAQVNRKSYPNLQNLYSEAKDKAAIENSEDGKDHPQGQRPALDRNRAQFSFKPMSSRSLPTVDFSSLDHIEDPEEYFLAFEQLQIADKELKRLRGEDGTDIMQHQRSTTARGHRPGILGKRYHFSINTDMTKAFRVPEEVGPDRRIASPSNISSITESTVKLHPEATEQPCISHARGIDGELFDATQSEGSVDLLEKLLSAFKNLDEDDAKALLRKSLKIKSIDVCKMRPTELDLTQGNIRRTLENGVPSKIDGPQLPQISSTCIGSPLTEISTLQRRISEINPLEDIPMPPIDDSPPLGDFYIDKGYNKQPISPSADIDYHNTSGPSDDVASTTVAVAKRSTSEEKMQSPVLEAYKITRKTIRSEKELTPEENDKSQTQGLQVASGVSPNKGQKKRATKKGRNKQNPTLTKQKLTFELQTHGLLEASGVSPNRGQKKRAQKTGRNKRKSTSESQTLASKRQIPTGIRRSTRIKSRPLEYWRGERFLYWRIHDSLATVIGVKYASPCKDGGAAVLKVKSFIPEEYEPLVSQAAA